MNYLQYSKDLEMRRAGVLHSSDLKASVSVLDKEDTTTLSDTGEQNPWHPFASTSCNMCPRLPRCFMFSHSSSHHYISPAVALLISSSLLTFTVENYAWVPRVTWTTGSGHQQGRFASLTLLRHWSIPVQQCHDTGQVILPEENYPVPGLAPVRVLGTCGFCWHSHRG